MDHDSELESQFTFDITFDNKRPEITEADETEVTLNPHETPSEGIKYRTADIERKL